MLKEPIQVVWVSDLHVGSTVGICPKQYTVDEGNIHLASEHQLFLLDFWAEFWKRRKKDGRSIILILGGDIVDGDHHDTLQVWTQDELIQVDAAVQLLLPIVTLAKKTYLLRGTAAHVGQTGRYDSRVAKELGINAYYHLRLNVGGVLFDLAHHGVGVGKRIWNIGNMARSYGRSIAMANILHNRPIPDVVVRGHVHRKCHETVRDGEHTTEVIISPSWQLKTEYAHRVSTEDDLSDIGGVIVGVDNGRVTEVTLDVIQFEQTAMVQI